MQFTIYSRFTSMLEQLGAEAAADYAAHLNACGGYAVPVATLVESVQMALDLAGEDGVVIAAGSLYFAGALRTELNLEWK